MSYTVAPNGEALLEARDSLSGVLLHVLDYSYIAESLVIGRHFGVHTSALLKDLLMNHVLVQLRKRPIHLALVDLSECELIAGEGDNWLESDYFPALRDLGLTHQAVVLNESLTTTVSVRQLETYVLGNFKVKYFFDFGTAISWLRSI
jgi:hypothetical protein